ncbi:hypothetical protein [Caldimonas sp. KR1-144]|uniref:hypothetical protein n=1 Tax=Caldimonas sp. KR1-144 TaxID=3400911 RepID=UPI003C0C1F16
MPDSFVELYQDERQRLTIGKQALASLYEFSEDMANLLVEQCQTLHHRDGIDEDQILSRCFNGLVAAPTSLPAAQAQWIVRRTAELLQWHWDSRQAVYERAVEQRAPQR